MCIGVTKGETGDEIFMTSNLEWHLTLKSTEIDLTVRDKLKLASRFQKWFYNQERQKSRRHQEDGTPNAGNHEILSDRAGSDEDVARQGIERRQEDGR